MHTTKLSNGSVTLLYPYPYLIIYADEGQQTVPLIDANYWTIGRGYDNSIVLSDKCVSRYHGALQVAGANPEHADMNSKGDLKNRNTNASSNFYLVDFDSCNGSFIRGQRITIPILLKSGDRVTIGKTDIDFFSPHKREPHRPSSAPLRWLKDTRRVFHQNDHPLTPSEDRVFQQVVKGFTNKEIGKRLQISPRTVQTHLSSIMTKLNLENRSQIVRYAFEQSYRPKAVDSVDSSDELDAIDNSGTLDESK
jgi:DNA-binding CsgD family transcriptional regulator